MIRNERYFVFILTVFLTMAVSFLNCNDPQHPDPKSKRDFNKMSTKKIADNFFLISGGPFHTNQLAVNGRNGTILVDSGYSPEYGKRSRHLLKELFSSDHYAYLINTHHHWDHVQGNQAFEDAAIIGHHRCRAGMIRQANNQRQPQPPKVPQKTRNKPAVTNRLPPPPPSHILSRFSNGFKLTLPSITIHSEVSIHSGDIEIRLICYDKGHSTSDLLVWFPTDGILVSGDLFFKDQVPILKSSNRAAIGLQIQILDRILSYPVKIKCVVPGHNRVMSEGDLKRIRTYLHTLYKYGYGKDQVAQKPKDWTLELFPANEINLKIHRGNIEKIKSRLYRKK